MAKYNLVFRRIKGDPYMSGGGFYSSNGMYLCCEELVKWFDVPDDVMRITGHLQSEPVEHGYKLRVIELYYKWHGYTDKKIQIQNPADGRWVRVDFDVEIRCKMYELFGVGQEFYGWVEFEQ